MNSSLLLKLLIACLILIVLIKCENSSSSSQGVYVRGYTKSNGTYVPSHYRSAPDNDPTNNWGYPGNLNPTTGKIATGDPDTYLERYRNRGAKHQVPNERVLADYPNQPIEQYNNTPNYVAPTQPYSQNSSYKLTRTKFYYLKQGALLRKGPGRKYPFTWQINAFQNLTILKKYRNGWSKVEFEYFDPSDEDAHGTGYIRTNQLTNSSTNF